MKKFHGKFAIFRCVLLLEKQAHSGDGRFDLVYPECIVFFHIPESFRGFRIFPTLLLHQGFDEFLIDLFLRIFTLRKIPNGKILPLLSCKLS